MNPKRMAFCLGALCASSTLALSARARQTPAFAPSAPPRPVNVLVILTDQHSAHALGSYGNGFGGVATSLTPNLDQLAREGVRFTNAHCAQPQCAPSRVSILTGLWPHHHGVRWNETWEPPGIVTFPVLFRDAGYVTATIGKHDLTWLDQPQPLFEDHGFDQVLDIGDYFQYCSANGQPSYFQSGNYWEMPGMPPSLAASGYTFSSNAFHPAGYWADRVIEFLEARAGPAGDGRPFVCFYSMYGPHTPVLPSGPADPHDWAHMYHPFAGLGLPPNLDKVPTTQRLLDQQSAYASVTDAQWRELLSYYYGLVSQIDWNIGRVLTRLEELGLERDTLVVYTSDHGDMASEMRCWGKGTGSYDAVTRVPLILRLPGVLPADAATDAPVSNVDLFPTLVEVAGVPVADSVRARLDGASLLDLTLQGPGSAKWRDEVFSEFGIDNAVVGRHRMVRTREWKYAYDDLYGGDEELYDLAGDPFEIDDLVHSASPSAQAILADLRGRLEAWWDDEHGHAPHYTQTGNAKGLPRPPRIFEPADGEVDVARDVDPSWIPSTAAQFQNVFFGTDPSVLPLAKELAAMESSFNPGTLAPATTYYWRVEGENANGKTPSDVWSFTTAAGGSGGPALATDPTPAHRAQAVGLATVLRWSPGAGTQTQDLYFGPEGQMHLAAGMLSADEQSFAPGPLAAGVTYEWRVDSRDLEGTTQGDVWSFSTTAVGLAQHAEPLFPPHLAAAIQNGPGLELRWRPGQGATSHDVYFASEFPLPRVANQTQASYLTGSLDPGRTYYWRIDEVNALGTRRGWTWRFVAAP